MCTPETCGDIEPTLRTVSLELTFDRLLLEKVMRHGYNSLCRRGILNHLWEIL